MLNFKSDISGIGGWLTEREGLFLYSLAKDLHKDGIIIEIGSWKGRSTSCFGLGSKDGKGSRIYAIDPHTGSSEHRKMFGNVDTYDEFINNIKRLEISDYIYLLRTTSEVASKEIKRPVDIVLIDGEHKFPSVKQDFNLWSPKVKIGGLILFHDSWHGVWVNLYTTYLLLVSNSLKNPKLVDCLTIFEKTEQAKISDRIKNVLFIIYRIFFGVVGWIRIWRSGTNLD